VTDSKRLQQVLKNLLSNAFKFTEQGGVRLNVSAVASGWNPEHPVLKGAAGVVAFEVSDTGIGIQTVETSEEAMAMLRAAPFDCAVLDLRLPDMSGFEVLEQLRDDEALSDLPVVVFTGKELSPEEDAQLHTLARSVVVKGVESPERLL
jgi:CheY-like chemotaxis protein